MRLRLTIQRHGLPPAQVLWTVGDVVRAPYAAAGTSTTISQLVEQVNDVIPLESEDWGLEDYAVEIRGFECLHFSELSQVLKEDDEVWLVLLILAVYDVLGWLIHTSIRPLETSDLRVRKISGRHQISSDGKHLIDGVAFGRPYLRRASRPPITIPSRKRRRIVYDEDEDPQSVEQTNEQQLIVRAGFDDLDEATADDESDDEEDFIPDGDEAELNAELEDLHNDFNSEVDKEGLVHSGITARKRTTRRSRQSPKGLGILRLEDENGRPFVGQYHNPLLDEYAARESFSTQPPRKVRKRNSTRSRPILQINAQNQAHESSASPQRISRRSSTGSNKSVHFEETEDATPATIHESEDPDEDDDVDFMPGEVGESDKENARPRTDDTDSSGQTSDSSSSSPSDDEHSSGDSDSDSDSDNDDDDVVEDSDSSEDTSSSGSSTIDSISDSELGQLPNHVSGQQSDTPDTSSNSSSSGSELDYDMPKTDKTKKEARRALLRAQLARANILPKSEPSVPELNPVYLIPTTVPPGQGKRTTQQRNRRRREKKKRTNLIKQGVLSPTATLSEFRDLNEGDISLSEPSRRSNDPESQAKKQDSPKDDDLATVFEKKRQTLLTSIASGGVDVDSISPEQDLERVSNTLAPRMQSKPPVTDNAMIDSNEIGETPTSESSTSRKEITLDMPSLRNEKRLLAENKAVGNASFKARIGTASRSPASDGIAEPEEGSGIDLKLGLTPDKHASPKETLSPMTLQRRNRLDLAGTKRMLFGSLGLRTPKTKEDELNLREKLMKNIKPVKEPGHDEEWETADTIAAAAADDSWKSKIDLRAIECCHQGIKLSTPPFPFIQRWDPQQEGRYTYRNGKKHKGKKRKRNNDNYYEEKSYQDSQNKAARYQSHDSPEQSQYEQLFQNGIAGSQHQVQAQNFEQYHEQEQEQYQQRTFFDTQNSMAASEQLLRETEEVSSETLKATPDLPALPEDLTTCPPLTRDATTTGTVIAFKQFQMGSETNWQPVVSGFRMAIVDEVTVEGSLLMTPAKRDRAPRDIQYDDETGDRIYGKFDMPGFNEGDEDSSRIELGFDEMISPILIRAALAPDESQEAEAFEKENASEILESPANVEIANDESRTVEKQNNVDSAADEPRQDRNVILSEESRAEISELIKDVGWRSSIGSSIDPAGRATQDVHCAVEHDSVRRTPSEASIPGLHEFESSQPSTHVQVRSSPIPTETDATKLLHASGTGIAESVPPFITNESDVRSILSNEVSDTDYPILPQLGDDSEIYAQEAQERSELLEPDHTSLSQDQTLAPMDQSPAGSAHVHIDSTLQDAPSSSPLFKAPHAIDSDDSLPPFSQAWEHRMSHESSIKQEQFSSQEEANSISPPARRNSKANGREVSSQREVVRSSWKPEKENLIESEGETTPKASQSRLSEVAASQVIDLTQSSDPVNLPDSLFVARIGNSHQLPSGPGWVKKTTTKLSSSAPAKANTGKRKTQSNRY